MNAINKTTQRLNVPFICKTALLLYYSALVILELKYLAKGMSYHLNAR